MPRAVIVTRHLYGYGGGAQAVLWMGRALKELGYEVVVHALSEVPPANLFLLGQYGLGLANYYRGCALHADLLLNIDHFTYEKPLARLNAAHIFHPHDKNRPPDGYQLFSSNSQFTSFWVSREWGLSAPALYIPAGTTQYVRAKQNRILHVSRFASPTELADKGHFEMIDCFKQLVEGGFRDWTFDIAGSAEDPSYLNDLRAQVRGYPIQFWPNVNQDTLDGLYARAALYWHATGVGYPDVHGAQEHLGLSTIEAMAAGCVPVVLGTGGQPEIVNNGITGWLCLNMAALVRMTADLINDPGHWSLMHRRAIEAARPWRSFSRFVERVACWLGGRDIPALEPVRYHETLFRPTDVCAVIVCHNGVNYTAHLLRKIYESEPSLGQVVVVDNASTDGTAQAVLDLMREAGRGDDVLIESTENIGYAAALNKAAESTDKPLLLAMNNDLLPAARGWLSALLQAMQPDVGVVGPKLVFPDGRLQHAGGSLDWNRTDIGYHRFYGQADCPRASQPCEVAFVTGACMLVRRELWNWPEWGGYGYEDVDVCLEARARGWKVLYEPASKLVHYEGMARREVPETQIGGQLGKLNRESFVRKWQRALTEDQALRQWFGGNEP